MRTGNNLAPVDGTFDELSAKHTHDMREATISALSVACPTCAAQPSNGCTERTMLAESPTLPYFHAARIGAASFVAGLDQPGEDHPITDALIDGAGLV